MQQGGTLKKRKKRNIAKVTGLSTIQYNELEDTFTGRDLFTDSIHEYGKPLSLRGNSDTRIRMTSSYKQNPDLGFKEEYSTNARRVTRNSIFHLPLQESFDSYPGRGSVSSVILSPPDPDSTDRDESLNGRSYFLDKSTIARLKQLLILGQAVGAFPFKWNSKENRVDTWSPWLVSIWKVVALLLTIQIFSLTGFQLYVFFNGVSHHTGSYRELFMTSFSVLWYIWADYFIVNLYFYKDEVREYINTLLQFNKTNMDKYVIHLDGYKDGGRLLINLAIPSNISQVFVSVSLFLRMPFQPWYLFSYIYPKPWYWLIPGAIQEFIVVGQVITSYMFLSWIIVAHTNSVEFWLRESHNHNDSDYTKEILRHPKKAIEMYRSLQILCTFFNDCMAPLGIPMVKICILTALLPCGYVVIRSVDKFVEEFPGILTYPLGVIDTAFAGFAFLELCAAVYDLTGGFVDSWSRTRNKDFRRILLSCPMLKVKVGRFYFVTISTTITFFKVAFDFVTDLIITFPA